MVGELPILVSFSGIDGAGKSTQILALESWLRDSGFCSSTLTMWDDVVVGPRFREIASRLAFRGDCGVGTPEKPVNRRDKNVDSWLLTIFRYCIYVMDAVSLRVRVSKARRNSDFDVVIFDRFIYDELANLPLERRSTNLLARLLLMISPEPDVAFFVDAEPEAARSRKPEYPLEFLRCNREAYLRLGRMVRRTVVLDGGTVEQVESTIRTQLKARLSRSPNQISARAHPPMT